MFSECEMLVLLSLMVLLFNGKSTGANEDPVVETPLGKIRGYTSTSRSGREFLAFSGIPYAKPPVGKLRFKPPEAPSAWEGIKDAKKEGPMCVQQFSTKLLPVGQEDCLYLSVFTRNISRNVPVLVHTHGGGYLAGYGGWYGPEFLMDEDIVLVKINYRLGAFGFLTFENPEWPGNQGMKDQVMALQWVQQNIASFGGDPNLVTIIGESAGGASVYNHIISPLSKGLFHRAVCESGTSYSLWAVAPSGFRRYTTEMLMTQLGCPLNPKEAMLCISEKEPYDILSTYDYIVMKAEQIPFGPVIEAPGPDSFIVGLPSEWNHNPVPLLIGADSAEGLSFSKSYLSKSFDFKWLSDNYNNMAPSLLGYAVSASHPDKITKAVRKYYLPNEELTIEDFVNLTMIITDSTFSISVMDGANQHKGNTYFYYCDYKVPIPGVDDKFIIGATHTAEARFLWNYTQTEYYPPIDNPNFMKLSEKFIKMVASFMKNGVPVIEGSSLEWKTWTPERHNYVLIDSNGFHFNKVFVLDDRYKFWKSINYRDKYNI